MLHRSVGFRDGNVGLLWLSPSAARSTEDCGAHVAGARIRVRQPNPGIRLGESQQSFAGYRRAVVEASIARPDSQKAISVQEAWQPRRSSLWP